MILKKRKVVIIKEGKKMRKQDAIKIIEEYYDDIYDDGNYEGYSVDDAYDKKCLEKIIKNNFILDENDRIFLNGLLEDVTYFTRIAIQTVLKNDINSYCFRCILDEEMLEIILKSNLEDRDISEILDLLPSKQLSKIEEYLCTEKIKYKNLVMTQTAYTKLINDNYDYIYEIVNIKEKQRIGIRYKHPDGEKVIKKYSGIDKEEFIFKINDKKETIKAVNLKEQNIPSHIYEFLLILKLLNWINSLDQVKQIILNTRKENN